MKNAFSLSTLLLVLINFAKAQEKEMKFGIKVCPAVAWTRLEPQSWTDGSGTIFNFEAEPVHFRGVFGVFGDYYFNDNIAASFGLNYLFNGAGYSVKSNNKIVNETKVYNIQYLQLPVSLKLITGEIADNIKAYLSPGLALDLTTGASIKGQSSYQPTPGSPVVKYTKEISMFALDFIVSTGIEYEIFNEMKFLIGVSYMHGLIDYNARDIYYLKNSGFAVRNSLLAIDLGIKF